MIKGVIFDLDMTLVDTSSLKQLRTKRRWPQVYDRLDETKLFEGVSNLIDNLKPKYKIGVVTSSPRKYAKKLIDFHDLNIPILAGYHDTSYHKPHPEPILYGIKIMDTPADSTIYAGDQLIDIDAAKTAGCISIGVTWGDDSAEDIKNSAPDFIANNPIEIQEIIDNND